MQILPRFLAQLGSFKPFVDNEWTNNVDTNAGALSTMELIISSMLGLLTALGGIFFIYTFLQGALSWISAGGDSGKIQKARDQMIQGAIGLIILVAAYAIIGVIGTVVGIDILTPAKMIDDVLL